MNKNIDRIPSETMDALVRYRWPGSIRELQNFIERAVILSPHSVLRAPVAELEPFDGQRESDIAISGLAEVERDHIVRALEASDWVVGGRKRCGHPLRYEADTSGLPAAEAWNNPPAGAPRRNCSQGWRTARLILLTSRSGNVPCDGTRRRNPSVSDISHEFVRQRLEVRQPLNPNHH
jgi:hypothetical protein